MVHMCIAGINWTSFLLLSLIKKLTYKDNLTEKRHGWYEESPVAKLHKSAFFFLGELFE